MKNLHRKFVELGRQRNRLLNEMLAILPEIYESGVWRKYAETIVEYAGKFGGISKSAVVKRLRLEKYLVEKPALREVIKTAGINKVAMVAQIATAQTDKAFADKVTNMSKSAIEMLSRELRAKGAQADGCAKADPTIVSPCWALPVRIKVELDEELSFLFMKLKQKWGMNNKEVMRRLLNQTVAAEFPEKRVSIKAMRTQTYKKVKSTTGSFAPEGALMRCVDPVTGEVVTGGSSPKPARQNLENISMYINSVQLYPKPAANVLIQVVINPPSISITPIDGASQKIMTMSGHCAGSTMSFRITA